jgi:predicted HTH transcriptional regulator
VITIDRVLRAKRESKHIEFKQCFDITAAADWCEVIKDIAAIANSGGGAIVFGADSKGLPVGVNVSAIAGLDSAHLTDKLHSYTGCHFAAFELAVVKKGKRSVAILRLGAASVPLIFTKPGTYAIDEKKQKTHSALVLFIIVMEPKANRLQRRIWRMCSSDASLKSASSGSEASGK